MEKTDIIITYLYIFNLSFKMISLLLLLLHIRVAQRCTLWLHRQKKMLWHMQGLKYKIHQQLFKVAMSFLGHAVAFCSCYTILRTAAIEKANTHTHTQQIVSVKGAKLVQVIYMLLIMNQTSPPACLLATLRRHMHMKYNRMCKPFQKKYLKQT